MHGPIEKKRLTIILIGPPIMVIGVEIIEHKRVDIKALIKRIL